MSRASGGIVLVVCVGVFVALTAALPAAAHFDMAAGTTNDGGVTNFLGSCANNGKTRHHGYLLPLSAATYPDLVDPFPFAPSPPEAPDLPLDPFPDPASTGAYGHKYSVTPAFASVSNACRPDLTSFDLPCIMEDLGSEVEPAGPWLADPGAAALDWVLAGGVGPADVERRCLREYITGSFWDGDFEFGVGSVFLPDQQGHHELDHTRWAAPEVVCVRDELWLSLGFFIATDLDDNGVMDDRSLPYNGCGLALNEAGEPMRPGYPHTERFAPNDARYNNANGGYWVFITAAYLDFREPPPGPHLYMSATLGHVETCRCYG